MTHFLSSSFFSSAAMLVGVVGAVWDIRTRRIPNLLTGPAMVAGLLLHFVSGSWEGLGHSFAALLLCGAIFLVVYLAGGMGAGDVKLIAAEGCLLGFADATALLAFTAISGGVLALVVAGRHRRLRQTTGNVLALASHHARHGLMPHPELNVLNGATLRLPYAVAICAGCLLTVGLRRIGVYP